MCQLGPGLEHAGHDRWSPAVPVLAQLRLGSAASQPLASADPGLCCSSSPSPLGAPPARPPPLPTQDTVTVLDGEELQRRQQAAVARVAELCCLNPGEAARVLRLFKW